MFKNLCEYVQFNDEADRGIRTILDYAKPFCTNDILENTVTENIAVVDIDRKVNI